MVHSLLTLVFIPDKLKLMSSLTELKNHFFTRSRKDHKENLFRIRDFPLRVFVALCETRLFTTLSILLSCQRYMPILSEQKLLASLLAAALLEFSAAAARAGVIAAGLGGSADHRFWHGLPGGKEPGAVLFLER